MALSFLSRLPRTSLALVIAGLSLGACGEAQQKPQDTAKIPAEPEVLAQETSDLKRRVKRLEQGSQSRSSQLDSIDGRLAKLSARLSAVEGALGLESGNASPSASAPRVAELEKRLGKLESQLAMGDGGTNMEMTSADGSSQAEGGAASGLQKMVARQVEAELDRLLGSQPRQYRVLPAAPAAGSGIAPAKPVRPEGKRYGLHLGSYRHMDNLLTGLGRLRQQHDLLVGMAVTAAEISLAGEGDFLRLLFGEFRRFERAEALCEQIANSTYCEVRRLRSVTQTASADSGKMGETAKPAAKGESGDGTMASGAMESGSMDSGSTDSGAMESGAMESGSMDSGSTGGSGTADLSGSGGATSSPSSGDSGSPSSGDGSSS